MNKYHVARRDRQIDGTDNLSLGFGGASFSQQSAFEYANDMNRSSQTYGTYFVVPAPFAGDLMPNNLSIGQQIRIVDYDHAFCGEFGNVRSVTSSGTAAIVRLTRFPGRLVGVCIEQVILAPSRA